MLSSYLDSPEQNNNNPSVMGIVASIYGWSTIGMASKISKTGRAYLPLTGYLNNKKGIGVDLVGRGLIRSSDGAIGGTSAAGKAIMGASYASRAVMGGMTIIDPVWSVASTLTKPYLWPLQVAWFGGFAMWRKAAQIMQKRQYVNMGNSFVDNGSISTSRQRAVRAIAESHLQARSAVGNEAMLFHHSSG